MDGWELASDCYCGQGLPSISIYISSKDNVQNRNDVLYTVIILMLPIWDRLVGAKLDELMLDPGRDLRHPFHAPGVTKQVLTDSDRQAGSV